MYVAWHFELLPRWAVGLVLVRELGMLLFGSWAVRKGVEVRINWMGRLAVGPVLAAPFWAMVSVQWFALFLLYTGMLMSWIASFLYARDAFSQLAEIRKASTLT
jgi:cardiolipin synthase